jgi:hypothetical protein
MVVHIMLQDAMDAAWEEPLPLDNVSPAGYAIAVKLIILNLVNEVLVGYDFSVPTFGCGCSFLTLLCSSCQQYPAGAASGIATSV